jgi:hypothetical protein
MQPARSTPLTYEEVCPEQLVLIQHDGLVRPVNLLRLLLYLCLRQLQLLYVAPRSMLSLSAHLNDRYRTDINVRM